MPHPPTAEQQAVVDAFKAGDNVGVQARAGTGKTTTMRGVAAAMPRTRIYYLAYNKVTAKEARDKNLFGANVRPVTIHALGRQWIDAEWGKPAVAARLSGKRTPVHESLRLLGIDRSPLMLGEGRVVQPFTLMRLAQETVKRFCYSTENEPQAWHVPAVTGTESDQEARAAIVGTVLPLARKVWKDVSHPLGRLRFEHDHYLKLWAMSHPKIDCDLILLDEAQDTNGVVAGLMDEQTHAQRGAVGDACQAIYGWRGATDYLSKMEVDQMLYLSQSFRFGQPVADEANKWLTLLDSQPHVVGAPEHVVTSTLGTVNQPDAVLCRTNAEAVQQLIKFHSTGVSVSLVGEGSEFKALASAAIELKERGRTSKSELSAFTSWGMVQEYVEHDAAGADLKVAVKLIDEHTPEGIIAAIDQAVPEGKGQVTVSTAHKSKGREWNRVKVASDFPEPKKDDNGDEQMPSREDMMLAYVTVTRAQRVLDREGLAWVDQYLGDAPGRARIRRALRNDTIGVKEGRALYREARRAGHLPTAHELATADR